MVGPFNQETEKKLPLPVWEFAALIGHKEDTIPSQGTTQIVRDACRSWAKSRNLPEECVLNVLQWDGMNRCYCFMANGMFHGVETDGHIHT